LSDTRRQRHPVPVEKVIRRAKCFVFHRHSGDSEDLGYLRGLMERGSTIGMDRFGLEHFLPTAKRVEVLARLCAEGYASKMVLSHDANCWSDMLSEDDKRRTWLLWHYNHISDDILPSSLRGARAADRSFLRWQG
jgi:phosphotriesterase-related protein